MKKIPLLYRCARGFFRPIAKLLFRYEVKNKDVLPESGSCILCCNHLSFADPVLLAITQKRQINYMAKKELFDNKIFGKLISKVGAFPVDRGSGDGKAINTAQELLNNGDILGIFLEGTRSRTGELLRPRAGVAMIAYQTGASVVPCCITPKKKLLKPFRKVKISYGEPLSTEQLGLLNGTPSEFRNAARLIMDKITELRNNDLKEFNNG